MRMTSALTALVSLACVGASGQTPPPGTDIVGIYTNDFDGPSYTHYEGTGPQVTLHVVFTGLSQPDLSGWELQVHQEGTGVMFLIATLLGEQPVNAFSAPVFQVTLGSPLTVTQSGAIAVASLLYFYLHSSPTTLAVNPIPLTSWPEAPGPGYTTSSGTLQRAWIYTGADGGTVFGFNTGIRPVDHLTWGSVKGMFR